MKFSVYLFMSILVMAPAAFAVPMMINVQGHVEVIDRPFDGIGQFKFAIVNGAGDAMFTEAKQRLLTIQSIKY